MLQNACKDEIKFKTDTVWKLSKCGVFSVSYFPVFGLNAEKNSLEKTPYLATFHAVPILN